MGERDTRGERDERDERDSAVAADIRACIAAVQQALHTKDLDALREVYADDVVSFDVEPPLQHVGIEAKLANWQRVFAVFREVDYDIRDLTLTTGEAVAFGHGFGRVSGVLADGTAVGGMWVRLTFGLRRIDGRWRIAHDQVSVPFDMATGRGVIDLEP